VGLNQIGGMSSKEPSSTSGYQEKKSIIVDLWNVYNHDYQNLLALTKNFFKAFCKEKQL